MIRGLFELRRIIIIKGEYEMNCECDLLCYVIA